MRFKKKNSEKDVKETLKMLMELEEAAVLGKLFEAQIKWVRIMRNAYKEWGYLTERQYETLFGIYKQVKL
jgi:hypothetical protein